MPAVSVRHHTAPASIAMRSNWSPEQAVAVFETLDELSERVWGLYGQRIQQALREQRYVMASPAPHNIDEADVPF